MAGATPCAMGGLSITRLKLGIQSKSRFDNDLGAIWRERRMVCGIGSGITQVIRNIAALLQGCRRRRLNLHDRLGLCRGALAAAFPAARGGATRERLPN